MAQKKETLHEALLDITMEDYDETFKKLAKNKAGDDAEVIVNKKENESN